MDLKPLTSRAFLPGLLATTRLLKKCWRRRALSSKEDLKKPFSRTMNSWMNLCTRSEDDEANYSGLYYFYPKTGLMNARKFTVSLGLLLGFISTQAQKGYSEMSA